MWDINDKSVDDIINEIENLGVNINNDNIRIIIAKCNRLNDAFVKYLKQKGIRLDVYLLDTILERKPYCIDLDIEIREKIDKEENSEIKNKRTKLLEKIGHISYIIEEDNPLFSDYMLEQFDPEDIASMYKYGYLLEDSKYHDYVDYYELLNEENRESFVHIYKEIVAKNDKEFDPVKFGKVAKRYMKNPKLFNQVVTNLENEDLASNLKQLFLSDYTTITVDSIEDIRNVDKKVLDEYKAGWGNARSKIIQMITGNGNNSLLLDKLTDERIKNIAECLDDNADESLLETLGNIQLINRLYDKINLNRKLGTEFAQALLEEIPLEERNFLIDSFKSAKSDLTRVYESELKTSLFSLDGIEEKAEEENKNGLELKEIEVDGETVKYVVVKSPAILIQHVMNAYNKAHDNGSLGLFTEGADVVSVPVFSTSVITNESEYILEKSKSIGAYSQHKINSENDVVVLFDSVPDGSLTLFGPSDCSVESLKNDLERISSFAAGDPTCYAPVREVLSITEKAEENGTEYLFYMHKLLKPAGIRVFGEEPTIYEVRAAEKLGVPIIKLEQAVEKSEQQRTEKDIKPNSKVKEIMDKIDKILDRYVDKNVSVSQIGRRTRDYDEMDFFEEMFLDEMDLEEFGDY